MCRKKTARAFGCLGMGLGILLGRSLQSGAAGLLAALALMALGLALLKNP